MGSNHWLCLGIGVAVGFFVLPAVLQMFGSKSG